MTNIQATEALIRKEKKAVDRSVNALLAQMGNENTLLPETPMGIVQRVVKIYRGARPALVLIRKLPLVPATWSATIDFLVRGLDALSALDIPVAFKAGKDI
jgi:hypothetical protein